MIRSLRFALAAIVGASIASVGHADTAFDRLTRLIPHDALAVIGAPNLRLASDELAQSVQAMDRGHALLGSKPLDQVKAVLGFAVGIDDLAAAAFVLLPPEAGAAPDESGRGRVLALIPVTDARTFLRGNFATGERHPEHDQVHAVRHARFGAMHARAFESHVAIARDARLLAQLQQAKAGEGFAARMMDEARRALASRGHGFLWVRDDLERAAAALPEMFKAIRESVPPLRGFQHGIASITFDPLGFFVRSSVAFDPESVSGRMVRALSQAPDHRGSLPQLPDQPFVIVASLNTRGLRGAVERPDLSQEVKDALKPYAGLEAVEFGWYTPAVPQANQALGAAVAFLRGGDAESRREAIEDCVSAEGDRWSIQWQRDQSIAGTRADRFELKFERRFPFENIFEEMFYLGPRRGYVGEMANVTFVSLGENEAAFAFARDAAAGQGEPLHQNHVIAAMQGWLPPGRLLELYIDPGEFAALSDGQLLQPNTPRFARGMPPIAFGLALREHHAESMLILPAGVLAPIVDSAMEQMSDRVRRRLRGPARD